MGRTVQKCVVSIHTPTQGVTMNKTDLIKMVAVSIHTPTQGVTKNPGIIPFTIEFQSTHPRRV